MKSNTAVVLKWAGLSEGGYVNHPDDPGGPTNHGVTQATYDAYRRINGKGRQSVKHLKKQVADQIFVDQYFRPVWFDQLPSGLDYAMADFSINSGPKRAVKHLQRIVKAKPDGIMGIHTMAAVGGYNTQHLIITLCQSRLRFMKSLRIWSTFKNGWTKRVMGKRDGVQTDDIGVIDRGVLMAQRDTVGNIPKPTVAAPHKAVPTSKVPRWVRWIARLKR